MRRKWLVSKTNPEFIRYLSEQASISPAFAQILVNRGFKDADSIRKFISPSIDGMHDPFLMPDMERAVERLRIAVEKDETVFVHGDYDADGVTSTAILVQTFRKLGLKTFYHIPDRIADGYGLGDKGIQKAVACKADIIITADCGISSEKEVFAANSLGIDVIITDHHEPPRKLPDALALIDPHRTDSEYPFKYLAGVGVAFKLIQALVGAYGNTPLLSDGFRIEELLDLVALGTIADSVPLIGENRIFATYGLKALNNGRCRKGITAIKEVAGINKDVRSVTLSYTIIPRINAAGRLDDAGQVVELFLTEDEMKAGAIAKFLEEQNRKRQKIEGDVLGSALDMIDRNRPDSAIVLASRDWHPGVIGIVASRLVDMFYRPVFLFSLKDSVGKGSARSIPPFHLYNAVNECSELLIGFGGHRQAAGLKIDRDNLPAFREKMNNIVGETLSDDDMVPALGIDAAVTFSDLNFNLINEIRLLEPYGESNREPVFGSKDITMINQRIVGNNHLKIQLKQSGIHLDSIGFNMGNQSGQIKSAPSLDIAYVPDINEWNGTRSLQLNLKAIRPGR